MDKLEHIFQMQKMLDDDIVSVRGLEHYTMEQWIQKDVLAIISELGELLDEINFKWWKNPKEIDQPALQEELIDILHFFISMCIRSGMDAQTMYDIYMDKNRENFDRQHGRSKKPGYEITE
ncbi:dUTPase [Eubacteriales bacterium OttesenSCG-928-K08]|nr:dUTPase [Eubacteriales bacterium OttesenSCG-928-K08]